MAPPEFWRPMCVGVDGGYMDPHTKHTRAHTQPPSEKHWFPWDFPSGNFLHYRSIIRREPSRAESRQKRAEPSREEPSREPKVGSRAEPGRAESGAEPSRRELRGDSRAEPSREPNAGSRELTRAENRGPRAEPR